MKNKHRTQNHLLASTSMIGARVTLAAAGLLLLTCTPRAFGWGITWADNFTGVNNQPSSANWSYQTGAGGWGNNELETYVNSWANAHVISDGTGTDNQALQIEAQTDSSGRWYSARINTLGKHSFGTGTYLEFNCKFPNAGQGYWPAAWCLGTSGGNWPADGEIDVAESIDNQEANYQTLHMPGANGSVYSPGTGYESVANATTTYNRYGMWLNNDGSYINFELNGNVVDTIYASSTPSGATWEYWPGRQFYVLLNLAIGGSFPGNPNGSTQANGNFDIDYVWQYN
jgi:beta-glucanase (GH16 family)